MFNQDMFLFFIFVTEFSGKTGTCLWRTKAWKGNQHHLLSVCIMSAEINTEQHAPQMILSVLIAVPQINRQTYSSKMQLPES